jgi:hypothetical protein
MDTKGKPAEQAPTGIPLLVAFDDTEEPDARRARKTWFAVLKAEHGHDRFCRECLSWTYAHDGRIVDLSKPTRYWLLPGTVLPRFAMHATYATKTGRQGTRDVIRSGADMTAAVRDFSAFLSRQGYTKIDIHARPCAPLPGDPA